MWPNREETDRLLDDARAGGSGAVDKLLAEFRDPLRRVIDLRLDPAVARRVDASDIVQDVLVEASQRLTDYLQKPDMPFHLWLRHLAQDRVIDTHRRHRLAQRRSVDREQAVARPAWADDREVILMRHHEALSNQEAAAALGLTEAAASMRYLRALRRLRAVLVPGGQEPADGV
jgi:RNA polymerase sigma-70 factor (ECF subfamily)